MYGCMAFPFLFSGFENGDGEVDDDALPLLILPLLDPSGSHCHSTFFHPLPPSSTIPKTKTPQIELSYIENEKLRDVV
jgi:hypothetical protein